MRSQKISNKAPRPFKNQFSDRGWSGGNRNDKVLPAKLLVSAKKPVIVTKDEQPASAEETSAPEVAPDISPPSVA